MFDVWDSNGHERRAQGGLAADGHTRIWAVGLRAARRVRMGRRRRRRFPSAEGRPSRMIGYADAGQASFSRWFADLAVGRITPTGPGCRTQAAGAVAPAAGCPPHSISATPRQSHRSPHRREHQPGPPATDATEWDRPRVHGSRPASAARRVQAPVSSPTSTGNSTPMSGDNCTKSGPSVRACRSRIHARRLSTLFPRKRSHPPARDRNLQRNIARRNDVAATRRDAPSRP